MKRLDVTPLFFQAPPPTIADAIPFRHQVVHHNHLGQRGELGDDPEFGPMVKAINFRSWRPGGVHAVKGLQAPMKDETGEQYCARYRRGITALGQRFVELKDDAPAVVLIDHERGHKARHRSPVRELFSTLGDLEFGRTRVIAYSSVSSSLNAFRRPFQPLTSRSRNLWLIAPDQFDTRRERAAPEVFDAAWYLRIFDTDPDYVMVWANPNDEIPIWAWVKIVTTLCEVLGYPAPSLDVDPDFGRPVSSEPWFPRFSDPDAPDFDTPDEIAEDLSIGASAAGSVGGAVAGGDLALAATVTIGAEA